MPGAEPLFLARELLRFLRGSTTPERFRAVMAYAKGIPASDIARREGVLVATIYDRIRRAREDFRAALAREAAAYVRRRNRRPAATTRCGISEVGSASASSGIIPGPTMTKRWVPLLTWTLEAHRYDDHPTDVPGVPGEQMPGIDLRDLKKLSELREAIVAYAGELWKRDNPSAKRLPRNWENAIELRFFRTEPGSCAITVFGAVPAIAQDDISQTLLFADRSEPAVDRTDIRTQLPEASDRVALTLKCVAAGEAPPFPVPPNVLTNVKQMASAMLPGDRLRIEAIERAAEPPQPQSAPAPPPFIPLPPPILATFRGRDGRFHAPFSSPAPYAARSSQKVPDAAQEPPKPAAVETAPRLAAALGQEAVLDAKTRDVVKPVAKAIQKAAAQARPASATFTQPVTRIGTVHKADIDIDGARVLIDGRRFDIRYSPEERKHVTGALHEHETAALRVIGVGVFDSEKGTLLRIDPPIQVQRIDTPAEPDAPAEPKDEQLPLTLPAEGGIANTATIVVDAPLTNGQSVLNEGQISNEKAEDIAVDPSEAGGEPGAKMAENARINDVDRMRNRLASISASSEPPLSAGALALASMMIGDVERFLVTEPGLPTPAIFANRAGQISFEWLPAITGNDIIASALLAVDGEYVDYFIADDDGVVLTIDSDPPRQSMMVFIAALWSRLRAGVDHA